MAIQRYTGENVEFPTTGDLVAYEDYAELKEEYERLDKSHSAALAKIDALAAENAALKSYIDDKCLIINPKGLGDVMDADSANVETPATDAILASLRAEGVEMFANHQQNKYDNLVSSGKILTDTGFSHYLSGEASTFAAQLRSKSEVRS